MCLTKRREAVRGRGWGGRGDKLTVGGRYDDHKQTYLRRLMFATNCQIYGGNNSGKAMLSPHFSF